MTTKLAQGCWKDETYKVYRPTCRAHIGNSTLEWAFQMGLGTLYCKAQSMAHLGLNELCLCLN